MTLERQVLEEYLSGLLSPSSYMDYSPNGLQIEGSSSISRIAFAVSASADSIRQCVDQGAQALIVHHGLFWFFQGARTLTGPFARRVIPLVKNNISLFAYHLPLDGHAEIGNAATLGKLIGLEQPTPFGDYKGATTGIQGRFNTPLRAIDLKQKLRLILDHPVILASPDDQAIISSLGIITGGANSEWRQAREAGLDAYLTGEISEHDWHESQEAGIHMFAGGHHATERFGIQALMSKVQQQFTVECFYIDSANPA